MSLCTFCLRHEGAPPFCPENPGAGCTYALGHEYPATTKPAQARRADRGLCARCGVHKLNPASASSGCAHAYADGAS